MSNRKFQTARLILILFLLATFKAAWRVSGEARNLVIPVWENSFQLAQETYKSHDSPLFCQGFFDRYCESLSEQRKKTFSDSTLLFIEYLKAQLEAKGKLPPDLLHSLKKRNYIREAQSFIHAHRAIPPTPDRNLESLLARLNIESIWRASVFETVARRMSTRFKDLYHPEDDTIPLELRIAANQIRNQLLVEVSEAIWTNHPRWQKVNSDFIRLKNYFPSALEKLPLPSKLLSKWVTKIRSTQLLLPGKWMEPPSPTSHSQTNENCMSTEVNAYYSTYLHAVTVCGGDFNSEEAAPTLAHELAHAIDFDSELLDFQIHSKIGQKTQKIKELTCNPKRFSCSEWRNYLTDFDSDLISLREFKPELFEFQKCLQRKKDLSPMNEMDEIDLNRMAKSEIQDRFSTQAEEKLFYRITRRKLVLKGGKSAENWAFLNPCYYYPHESNRIALDDPIYSLVFFTAAYRCSHAPPSERLAEAIETSRRLSLAILREILRAEGSFSPRENLENLGYASSPAERFADVIGSHALSQYLLELPSAQERWTHFLSGSSWLCTPASLEADPSSEAGVENQYILGAHSQGNHRKMELFTPLLRKTLGCQKDFEFEDCSL